MTFEFTTTPSGFRIRDTIENTWSDVDIGRSSQPASTPTETAEFRVPVDEAITVETTELGFDRNFSVIVRDPDGSLVDSCSIGNRLVVEPGIYELETTLTLFKLYIRVSETGLTIEDSPDGVTITFDGPARVVLGVRSFHEHPAGVVTTSQDPAELMRAISTFGSALKTLSPERSFPSLRGHPPELAVRGQSRIPAAFEPPSTGITVEMPPEYAAIFTATPLAYYFGATIEPGLEPRFLAADASYQFDPDTLAADVHSLLQHCFTLDVVVRTAGIYPLEMDVERRLRETVEIDKATLYDLPLDERTARYLDVPFEATRDLVRWPAVADIDPVPLNAESLPYLAYRMSTVRSPATGSTRINDCCTSTDTHTPDGEDNPVLRSFTPGEPDNGNTVSLIEPAPFDADHNIWVADGFPVTGSKPTLGSYLQSTESKPHDDTIDVHVVDVATPDTRETRDIASQYSNEGFDVTLHEDPTTSDLKDIFLTDHDFLHYMGEVSDEGLECIDGPLDVRTLPRTGVSAFFLDGTCSYRQGLPLIRVGGIGGIVTTTDELPNVDSPGRILAGLLDYGFPLLGAVDVLADLADDEPYTIVGDAYHQISKRTQVPKIYHAQPDRSTSNSVTLRSSVYPTKNHRIGTIITTPIASNSEAYLTGTHDVTFQHETFSDVYDRWEAPFVADGELQWPEYYSADELWDLLQ